jgi:hypothetical protein
MLMLHVAKAVNRFFDFVVCPNHEVIRRPLSIIH